MRKSLLTITILILGVAELTKAQAVDSAKKILKIVSTRSIYTTKPLILINGTPYDDDFATLNYSEIHSVKVLKGSIAAAMYGSKGANGVIIFQSSKKSHSVDTLSKSELIASISTDSINYVIDDELVGKDVLSKKLNSADIIEIIKIKGVANALDHHIDGLVVITTKPYATCQYQEKLSSFCKEYKDFLDVNHNDDSRVIFIIDGTLQSPTRIDGLRALFNLKEDNIKKIEFSKGHEVASGWKPAVLFITTKVN